MLTSKLSPEEIFKAVEAALPDFHKTHEHLHGHGFALTLIGRDDGYGSHQIPAERTFGLVGPKSAGFVEESRRKTLELKKAYEQACCLSSFEIQNVVNKHHIGGAIVGKHYYMGGAGFGPEYNQEFLLFVCTKRINELTPEASAAIEARSRSFIEKWRRDNPQSLQPVATH